MTIKKEITKLTSEQESRLSEIAIEWIKYGISTNTDREKAESLIPAIYKEGGLKPPAQVLWCESPYVGYKKCKEFLKNDEQPLPCYGSHDSHWLAFYAAFFEFGIDECDKLNPLMDMAKCSGWFFPMDKVCILTPNPIYLGLDDRGRLHNNNGKAIEYPDGWGLYYIHGVAVNKKIVEHPETITVKDIEDEKNVEVRRVMIDRYGFDCSKENGGVHGVGKYIQDAGAKEIHSDKWGTLYCKELEGDEKIVTIKVSNSTPEPDGTRKSYFLRVDPSCTTAHQAVAWTFGIDKENYIPIIET